MKRGLCALAAMLMTTVVFAGKGSPAAPETLARRTAGLQRQEGFLPYYWDPKKDELLFELSPSLMGSEFLYFTGYGTGIGSIRLFADRSTIQVDSALCRFQRAGSRVLVIEENPTFRAEGAELRRSVEMSFPTSVLAALPVEAERDGTLLVNAGPLLIRDAADLLSQLRHPVQAVNGQMVRQEKGEGSWKLDASRSVIDSGHSGAFPRNTEIEALLTFTTDEESRLNQPDPHLLSLRQHHSFVKLPPPGFRPREMDPRVGFFPVTFLDFSQPFDRPLRRRFIERWRLEKADPESPLSEPVKPLVFYLDRAVPEPMRSALRRGALWWNRAFEQAGFKNALRIEDLPEGANPMDLRYPTLQWTNRSGRGWSVGMTEVDPRTGEILHAVVQLDSHRMRTLGRYWEALMPPEGGGAEPDAGSFAALDGLDPATGAEQVTLNRLALLTCHEMGHALGLDHNFVASTFSRGSVMDYYAPRVRIRPDGSADLSDAYMQGVGSYDRFAVEWGYSEGKPGADAASERRRLGAIVRRNLEKGIVWGNTGDPRWNAYDDGADPVSWLKEVLPVRDALVKGYGAAFLRKGEPVSNLASRFPLIYLFHRYALSAAVNVIGGAEIPPSLEGDGQDPVTPWPAAGQREALRLVLKALEPAELEVPPRLWKKLAPPEPDREDPERFASSAGYLFSPQDGARAVVEIVAGGLLDPERLQRLEVLRQEGVEAPSPGEVVSSLVKATFGKADGREGGGLAGAVQTEVAERLMLLSADERATPEVQAEALAGVRQVRKIVGAGGGPVWRRLDHEIGLFLADPRRNAPRPRFSGAPPGPPI